MIGIFFVPAVTFASWWNPTTWFKKPTYENVTVTKVDISKNEGHKIILNTSTTTQNVPTGTSSKISDNKEQNVSQLKKQVFKNEDTISKNNEIKRALEYCEGKCKEKKELRESGKQKCLNGNIILLNETCTRTCPDGEIIAENIKCKTENSSTGYINNTGLYYIDPNAGYSPEQISNIKNATDAVYGNQFNYSESERLKNEMDYMRNKQNKLQSCIKSLTGSFGGSSYDCNNY